MTEESVEAGLCFVRARVLTPNGQNLSVTSLRLEPPLIRLDFWQSACWQSYSATREKHRQQLRDVIAGGFPGGLDDLSPIILGGDFNLVARDPALDVLPDWLSDSFRTVGRGWGNTIVSDLPIHRIDQAWTSSQLKPTNVWVVFTPNSDHRMVVTDLEFTDR
ncbi:MAG: endonuclease/exonuclease/phosphatase family protein [Planctomycetia bacterium]|nr:endonuclease/exonuclease/phosphatase family protein [Planctomycetia bacterium]